MDGMTETEAETEAKVFRVMPENITPLWQQLEPLVVSALRTMTTHEPEDVRKMLMTNNCHLWIQWSDRVEAMIVTEFVSYPRGLWLRLWLGATADGAKMDRDAIGEALEEFRLRNGCVAFEIIGRIGWGRVFPGLRYEAAVWRGLAQ